MDRKISQLRNKKEKEKNNQKEKKIYAENIQTAALYSNVQNGQRWNEKNLKK